MDRKKTAFKLKLLRGNLSKEFIATQVGVSKSAWNMYERGERVPRDEVKVSIANYFGKTVQEIFFDDESTNSAQHTA